MNSSYWSKTLKTRMGRRRALVITGGSAAAAAFLAACGGDDDDAPPASTGTGGATGTGGGAATGATGPTASTGAASGIVASPADTFAQAKRTGTLKDYASSEPQTMDPISPVAPLNALIRNTYGTLMTEEPGHLTNSPGELRGDLVESWEVSPDRLLITMKLRQGVTFHNKAPVNGRTVDVDDVLFSWRRYTELSPFRELAYNGANPEAPIESLTATDGRTLVAKLKEPLAYALRYFGIYGSQSGNMMITPKEADGGYDLRHEMIGHGPFVLTEATPAVGYTFERHDGYYDKDWAAVQKIEMPIVPEYAARVSQFKAGNLHRLYGNDPLGEDVVVIKGDEPKINVYQTGYAATPWIFIFGAMAESPFLDQRVRQAISMGIDREAAIDVTFNVDGFDREGLPVEHHWNSHLLSSWNSPPYWLDPQGSDFGPNAKYFEFNLEEAKALLSAAGHANGFSTTSNYPVERLNLTRFAEPIDGMLRNLGLDITINTPDYATEYIPQIRDGKGQFEGWGYGSVTGVMPQALHPVSSLAAEYWPKGGVAFRGFSAGGTADMSGDPELTRMIEKARLEFDEDALQSQIHDIQRYLAEKMWGLNMPGGATGFTLAWPALQNVEVWNHRQSVGPNWNMYQLWMDETKAPFA